MRKPGFTDAELRSAAVAVRRSLLASLPEPEDCVHEFSASFYEKMNALLRRERRRDMRRRVMRRVAAVLAVFFIGSGIWICIDAEARAAFLGWIREVYENSIVYRFNDRELDMSLPVYRPTWLPEGVSEEDVWENKIFCSIMYKDADGADACSFTYYYSAGNTHAEIVVPEEEYEYKALEVKGYRAEFYLARDDENTSALVWLDENQGMFFSLNSYFGEDIMLRIAESVILTK